MQIAIVTISDRASRGDYEDKSGPAIEAYLKAAITTPWTPVRCVIPDGLESVSDKFRQLCDDIAVDLILSTGGTGP